VPFGGLYRVIDFTLSNCLNSGLKRIYVLTQHKSLSLDRHVRLTWNILHPERGEFVQTVPPQLQLVSRWYAGTADAVFQNIHLLDEERPERVLVVSGDHIYRLDYRPLLAFHAARGAALTIGCTRVPCAEATRMGVVQAERDARVRAFDEKPAYPVPLPDLPTHALVSMGVYVFDTEPLVRALIADAKCASEHDFGRSVIPMMVQRQAVYAFDVAEHCPDDRRYWQDVGTIDSYFEATMGMLAPMSTFPLHDPTWPIHTEGGQRPPALVRNADGHEGRCVNSILSPGCLVSGGSVEGSVLSPGVVVETGATVEGSVLMPAVRIGKGAQVRRAIVDEGVVVPPGTTIGCDPIADRRRFAVTPGEVVVVAAGTIME
jgi:glucose-1-phosphate adenylyltransferase